MTLPRHPEKSTTHVDAPPQMQQAAAPQLMRVSRYERVAALLIALLIIVGLGVGMMFVVWASGRVWVKQAAITPQLIEPLAAGGDAMGATDEFAEPGEEELDDFEEPLLEQTIDSVTDQLSTSLATVDSLGAEAPVSTAGGAAGNASSVGEGGDANIVPRWARWEVKFSAADLRAYARQLDYFQIELGAAGGSHQIDYAAKLSQDPPQTRTGNANDESRMYLTWRYGPLRAADTQLLTKAGISSDDRIVMQFLPPATENQLAVVEDRYLKAKKLTLENVAKTVFRVLGQRGKYNFEVASIQAR